MGYKALWYNREHYLLHEWRKNHSDIEFIWSVSEDLGVDVLNQAAQALSQSANGRNETLPEQFICVQLNESACPILKNLQNFTITIYNGNSRPMSTSISIPIYDNEKYQVYDSNGATITTQVLFSQA
uniref:Uncharacterized protein n=1 Tax=Acrobeloides nanus TaxID=290746 RepID=A0A914DRD0_9BILA